VMLALLLLFLAVFSSHVRAVVVENVEYNF
jgi:hypothetical protein